MKAALVVALSLAWVALASLPVGGQVPEAKPPVLVELGNLKGALAPDVVATIRFNVTLQCTPFFQPTPGSTMTVAYNVTMSEAWGFAFPDKLNDTLGADVVNCAPGDEAQTNGNVTVLLGDDAPAFATVDVTLDVTVTSGSANESGSDNASVEVAFRKRLSVSIGSGQATVPPGGNLTVKINVVNNGNAPVTATAQTAKFEGTGSLTPQSFTVTFPGPIEIGSKATGDESNVAIFEVTIQTPSGGLFVGEEGTFTFNVTANPTERPDLDGGSGEVEYKVLVQGKKRGGDGDGGKKKGFLPGFEAPLFAAAVVAAAMAAGRRR